MTERGLKNINVFYSTFTNVFFIFVTFFLFFSGTFFYIYGLWYDDTRHVRPIFESAFTFESNKNRDVRFEFK